MIVPGGPWDVASMPLSAFEVYKRTLLIIGDTSASHIHRTMDDMPTTFEA